MALTKRAAAGPVFELAQFPTIRWRRCPSPICIVYMVALLPACQPAVQNSETRECWESHFLGGAKIGYGHMRVSSAMEDGVALREMRSEVKLKIWRFGEVTEQHVAMVWLETPSRELVRFETRMSMGPREIVTRGKPVGNSLEITTEGSQTTRIPWQSDWGGFFSVEQSLERQPMEPGQRRNVRAFMPVFHTVADIQLEAIGYEETAMLRSTEHLLKLRSVTRFQDGNTLETFIWTDAQGRTRKTLVPDSGQESYRTTRHDALDDSGYGRVDLGHDMIVKVSPPLTSPHASRRIVYHVHLPHRDPKSILATGVTQEVKSLSPHEAELIVHAVRPGEAVDTARISNEGPSQEDLASCALIQSDDERVVMMAEQVASDEKDTWQVAQALERAVYEAIDAKDFSQAFATAADVVRTRRGDCTEHAVLLAALCRARQIPARVAIGLVYHPAAQGFAYHMWNEVWIGDRWIPLDATLGLGGIGAAHVKFADSNLHGTSAYSMFLPVLHVLGKLTIEIVDVQ